ncbi:hypothetical protein MAR_021277, partial [Mya arenaria]
EMNKEHFLSFVQCLKSVNDDRNLEQSVSMIYVIVHVRVTVNSSDRRYHGYRRFPASARPYTTVHMPGRQQTT